MIDYLLSPDGQEIIEGTGYARLNDTKVSSTIENTYEKTKPELVFTIKDRHHQGQIKIYKNKYEDTWFDEFYELDFNGFHDKGSWWLDDNGYSAQSFGRHYELIFNNKKGELKLSRINYDDESYDDESVHLPLPQKGAILK